MEDVSFSGGSTTFPAQSAPAGNENIGFDDCCCFQYIHTQEVGVVENLGQFQRILDPGCHLICWPFSLIAGRIDLRIQQVDVWCRSKTKDSACVVVNVSIHYKTIGQMAYNAFYRLTDPRGLIRSCALDIIHSTVPKMDSEEVLRSMDDVAAAILQYLRENMKEYGYEICEAFVTKVSVESWLDVAAPLTMAMNERDEKLESMPEVATPLMSTLNECTKSSEPISNTVSPPTNALDRDRTPSENPPESPGSAIPEAANVVYKGTEYIG